MTHPAPAFAPHPARLAALLQDLWRTAAARRRMRRAAEHRMANWEAFGDHLRADIGLAHPGHRGRPRVRPILPIGDMR